MVVNKNLLEYFFGRGGGGESYTVEEVKEKEKE